MNQPIRILFVEDDPEMRAVYQENFVRPEFDVTTAANGTEALAILQGTVGFDVVVSDNYMPEMDGITLLKRMRELYPDVRVVIVTGYGNWSDYVDAHNLGVWHFIDKPVKIADLKKLIRSLDVSAASNGN
jgi:DNA-binding NtrC family response regulator